MFAAPRSIAADGYIHFSAADQAARPPRNSSRAATICVLVARRRGALGAALRWEPSRGGALFPHLYAPLPLTAVALGAAACRWAQTAGTTFGDLAHDRARSRPRAALARAAAAGGARIARRSWRSKSSPSARRRQSDPQACASTPSGSTFPNPLGLAAGFDKNAEAAEAPAGARLRFRGGRHADAAAASRQPQAAAVPPDADARARSTAWASTTTAIEAGRARGWRARPPRASLGVNFGPNKDAADRVADLRRSGSRPSPPLAELLHDQHFLAQYGRACAICSGATRSTTSSPA